MANQLDASWSSSSVSAFLVDSLTASGATVRDASGATVGVGTVVLAAPGAGPAPLEISGNVQYSVSGEGSLSFYGSAASGLGVSGDWGSYSATVSGGLTLGVNTGVLTLNGSPLPAGSYSITAASANFNGSGRSSSPSFSGAVTIAARDASLDLGKGTGTFNFSGGIADPVNGLTLAGYTGSITVTAGSGDTDAVTLDGAADQALSLSGNPSGLMTDQNTSFTIQANVHTSFADTYEVSAQAPPGWTVAVDANGLVTLTPAPGVQGGSYPIQLVARSMTRPDLVAQAVVNVTITPTLPGIALDVAPDPIYFVPFNGAPLPTAFRATLHNSGPVADTFDLTFAGVPAGFQVISSKSSVTIPAGQTAMVGIYLQATSQVPPVGTQLSFNVSATSASDPASRRRGRHRRSCPPSTGRRCPPLPRH